MMSRRCGAVTMAAVALMLTRNTGPANAGFRARYVKILRMIHALICGISVTVSLIVVMYVYGYI